MQIHIKVSYELILTLLQGEAVITDENDQAF